MLAAHPEFETRVVPLVEVDGETVSSTRIRALVAAGDMEGARRCLGAPFMVEGTVVKGDQRGRELGFPTANIVPDDRLVIPGHGVYAAFANGVPAAVNVGVRPTFETGRGVLIETYLIDREEDLYGPRPAGRLRRAAARREALPRGRGADRADASSTSRTPSASAPPSPAEAQTQGCASWAAQKLAKSRASTSSPGRGTTTANPSATWS